VVKRSPIVYASAPPRFLGFLGYLWCQASLPPSWGSRGVSSIKSCLMASKRKNQWQGRAKYNESKPSTMKSSQAKYNEVELSMNQSQVRANNKWKWWSQATTTSTPISRSVAVHMVPSLAEVAFGSFVVEIYRCTFPERIVNDVIYEAVSRFHDDACKFMMDKISYVITICSSLIHREIWVWCL